MSQLIYPLRGGVHPPENKQQSLGGPIRPAIIPKTLVLPLAQHIGAPAEPIVEVGERVLAGQLIAEPAGPFSAGVHASSSGKVVAIEPRPIAHPSGMPGECIVIETDGEDRWLALEGCEQPFALDNETLLAKVRKAGIAGMGGAGFPAAVKLKPPANMAIDTLIINGTECEPYITADDVLMQNRADAIIRGALLLAKLLGGPEKILIGVEDNKPQAIEKLQAAKRQLLPEQNRIEAVQIISFPTKYPSGGEKQLIQILTGQEVPSGGLPAQIGIVVQNVGTTVAIWEAVTQGKPLVERITTVVGESLGKQGNAYVRIGTPAEDLLAEFGFKHKDCTRLIAGGPMMGFSLDDMAAPLVKTSNCLLAPSHSEMPEPAPAQACIRCGQCAEACPAGLLPQQLYWYARAKEHERLLAHNLMDCIECGACAFVCPSSIPLVQYYRASKGEIRQAAIDKEKSDRSRLRFEARQARLERAEAEKAAKREARKQAAEAAKAKAAAQAQAQPAAQAQAQPAAEKTAAAADPVAAAIARVQAKQTDPAEQLAKLERARNSAQSRVEATQAKLEAATEEQKPTLEARLKQAQQRLQDAQQKLDEFNAQAQPAAADPVAAAIAKAQARINMNPAEKMAASLESLQQRLAKAKEKLAAQSDAEKAEALKAGISKLEQKIAVVEAEIAEHQAAGNTASSAPAPEVQVAAGAAIEKAKAKAAAQASMSPEQKQLAQLESLRGRLEKAEARLAVAEAEGDDNIDAFRTGADKLKQKVAALEAELGPAAEPAPSAEAKPAEEKPVDAAGAAIEKAKAKAAAQASMSPAEKQQAQLEALRTRLSKAEARLAKAEAEGDENIEAFKAGVDKLQAKLADMENG
ncbi:MAG: electron transport complex subunit RsxC [Cellvibrionaceae bacterium]|nr:electron transport complex subunit RsxC [Cellvibrionaceae bacterium]